MINNFRVTNEINLYDLNDNTRDRIIQQVFMFWRKKSNNDYQNIILKNIIYITKFCNKFLHLCARFETKLNNLFALNIARSFRKFQKSIFNAHIIKTFVKIATNNIRFKFWKEKHENSSTFRVLTKFSMFLNIINKTFVEINWIEKTSKLIFN